MDVAIHSGHRNPAALKLAERAPMPMLRLGVNGLAATRVLTIEINLDQAS